MKTFLIHLKSSILLTLVMAIVLCGIYPLAVWTCAQLAFPSKANGSLIYDENGTLRGSSLIGQTFISPRYFHSRPSAAGTGYDAAASGGSNLGPTSQKLMDTLKANIAAYRAENNLPTSAPVPADAVTMSASGLDPHISVANALLQAARVAQARQVPLDDVRALIAANTQKRDLGFFGEEGVNVVMLNRALDTR